MLQLAANSLIFITKITFRPILSEIKCAQPENISIFTGDVKLSLLGLCNIKKMARDFLTSQSPSLQLINNVEGGEKT